MEPDDVVRATVNDEVNLHLKEGTLTLTKRQASALYWALKEIFEPQTICMMPGGWEPPQFQAEYYTTDSHTTYDNETPF